MASFINFVMHVLILFSMLCFLFLPVYRLTVINTRKEILGEKRCSIGFLLLIKSFFPDSTGRWMWRKENE